MDFTFDAQQNQFRDAVRSFLVVEAAPERLREYWETPTGRSAEMRKKITDQGITSLSVPEAYGGLGMGDVDWVQILEQVGYHGIPDSLAEAAYLAAMPKAPSNYHPVREKERAIERRNFVLREMNENGYLTDEEYQTARASDLETVQSGDIPSARAALPPRDYFTDEIRRQLSRNFGEEEFFGGGLTIRATVDPELQKKAAVELQRALERYDRGLGRWRGTGKTIDVALLEDEAKWREALAAVEVARDVELESPWLPAVVLSVGDNELGLGIEGVAMDGAESTPGGRGAGRSRGPGCRVDSGAG